MVKTAFAYVSRKIGKSLLIVAIVAIMAMLSMISLGMQSATRAAAQTTFKNITNSFSLQINRQVNPGTPRGGGNIRHADIQKIEQSPYISSSIRRVNAVGNLSEASIVTKDLNDGHDLETRKHFEQAVMITGVNTSARETKFVSGAFKLIRGKPITPKDRHSVLVHEALAAKNNWRVGDTITLRSNTFDPDNERGADKTIRVQIQGLFKGNNKQPVGFAVESYANEIVSDLHTAATLYGKNANNVNYQDATFFVRGEHNLDMVLEQLQRLPIDYRSYMLVKSAENFPALQASIQGIQDIAVSMGWVSFLFAGAVLTLCLVMWMHVRTNEIGIFVSLGLSKLRIVGQFGVELLITGVLGFVVALVGAWFIGQHIQTMVLQHVNQGVAQEFARSAGQASVAGGAELDGFSATLRHVDLSIQPGDMLLVALGGCVVMALALACASYGIWKKSPKALLSELV